MSEVGGTFLFKALMFLLTFRFSTQDINVSCVYLETCLLPCSFEGGTNVSIHWSHWTAGFFVHAYNNNEDQLTLQEQSYRNRTSLFKELISRGNASLQLTGVKAEDKGRYRCYTSNSTGNKESFINLEVDVFINRSSSEATNPTAFSNATTGVM